MIQEIEIAIKPTIFYTNNVCVGYSDKYLSITVSLPEDSSWFKWVYLKDKKAVKTAILTFFEIEGDELVKQVRDWFELEGKNFDDYKDIELVCSLPLLVNYAYLEYHGE